MMIGNVSDAYNDYKIYPYALEMTVPKKILPFLPAEECQTCKNP